MINGSNSKLKSFGILNPYLTQWWSITKPLRFQNFQSFWSTSLLFEDFMRWFFCSSSNGFFWACLFYGSINYFNHVKHKTSSKFVCWSWRFTVLKDDSTSNRKSQLFTIKEGFDVGWICFDFSSIQSLLTAIYNKSLEVMNFEILGHKTSISRANLCKLLGLSPVDGGTKA